MSSTAGSIGSRAAEYLGCTWSLRGCSTSEQGIGGFILVRHPQLNTPKGLIIGKREPALGLRGIPESELIFDNLERGLRHGLPT